MEKDDDDDDEDHDDDLLGYNRRFLENIRLITVIQPPINDILIVLSITLCS